MAIAFFAIAALVLFIRCTPKHEMTQSVDDPKTTPNLIADSITTIISDSGIIRYRITAEQLKVYNRADTPYWHFPFGLHFERFDEDYDVDAQIECRHAYYYNELEQWKLNDSVHATNLNGEIFETQELYWDQKTERVYSDSLIKITQKDKIIIGIGFQSNQTFTKYTINQPKGILPVDEE